MSTAANDASSLVARRVPDRHGDDVQPKEAGRDAAREALLARMRVCGFGNVSQLAADASVSHQAISEFLRGARQWPKGSTRAKVEVALAWEPGELARIAAAADQQAAVEVGRRRQRQRRQRLATAARRAARREQSGRVAPQTPTIGPAPDLPSFTATRSGLVLEFAPGVLEGLSPAEASEIEAAAVLAALQRMREIRAAQREHGGGTDASGSTPDR